MDTKIKAAIFSFLTNYTIKIEFDSFLFNNLRSPVQKHTSSFSKQGFKSYVRIY